MTGIEWTDRTWNPTTGCDRVSPGCDHCYAMTMAKRLKGMGSVKYEKDGDPRTSGPGFGVSMHADTLGDPLKWRKPQRVFVNSMSDLFHDEVSDEFIAQVFAVMALASRHTFQVLTKRHARMRSLLSSSAFQTATAEHMLVMTDADEMKDAGDPFPLPNVWLGVSAENQQWADIRIPALLDTPAAVRFISAEPLLGPIDLTRLDAKSRSQPLMVYDALNQRYGVPGRWQAATSQRLDWVIVGGESGRDTRPMHPDWVRSLRDQCEAAGVAFLFKQWGEWATDFRRGTHLLQTTGQLIARESGTTANPYGSGSGVQDLVDRGHPGWVRVRRAGKKAAGRELDGRTWDQYPEVVTA